MWLHIGRNWLQCCFNENMNVSTHVKRMQVP